MIRLSALLILIAVAALAACGPSEGGATRTPNSDVRAQRLDSAKVPEDLRPLVPLAERWGIGDDMDRNAKVDRVTPEERTELQTALEPLNSRITQWLNSFGQGAMTDEAAAFMYMQLALEEMTAGAQ